MNLRNDCDQSLDEAFKKLLQTIFLCALEGEDVAEAIGRIKRVDKKYYELMKALDEL